MVRWVVGSILHGVDPLSYFSFQPVLHDWCNKGRSMYYPVCGMMHIKEPLLLIRKSSPCGGSRFPLSLYVWFFTICLTSYHRKQNVLSASLNKIFPSFRSHFHQLQHLKLIAFQFNLFCYFYFRLSVIKHDVTSGWHFVDGGNKLNKTSSLVGVEAAITKQ